MKVTGFAIALAGLFAGATFAQTPTVGGLLNNYSFTLPGLPNYGIAEGSIFDIYGTNFTAAAAPLQGPPLQSTLNGVTISVTVNGTTTHPLFYYLGPNQIDAVLPSATPVGTGTITVATSAGTSTPFPITVVASAFGLLTSNNGTGPAQGYNANNNGALFGFTQAVNPGEILELWGTGLGPVNDDATDVAVTPTAQVFIGGVAADVLYAGRSGYTGLDQINIKVPNGVTGCYVSVVVQTGNVVSNFGTLPVAASGRTCTDVNTPFSSSLLDGIGQGSNVSVGFVSVSQLTTPGITVGGVTVGGTTTNEGSASFSKITSAQFNQGAFASALGGFASAGSCYVDTFQSNTQSTALPVTFQFDSLNAGPDVNINGPDGLTAMPLMVTNGIDLYTTPLGAGTFIPAGGGTFKFDNGSGGPDVGAFTATLQMAPAVTWTNTSDLATVTRANPMTVNWSGGSSGNYVGISGFSLASINGSTTDYLVGFFTCAAPATAGTFTVPSSVLLALPPSSVISEGGASLSLSYLFLSSLTAPVTFTAPNLDLGIVDAAIETLLSTTYQ